MFRKGECGKIPNTSCILSMSNHIVQHSTQEVTASDPKWKTEHIRLCVRVSDGETVYLKLVAAA